MKTIILSVIASIFALPIYAQEEKREKERKFLSLEEALKTPNQVYKLDLSNQGLKAIPKELRHFPNLEKLD